MSGRDRDQQAIREYLDKLDPNAANRRSVQQRVPTIVAQQCRLPGKPEPAGQILAEYQEHNAKRRERIPGPLWVFWAPTPKTYSAGAFSSIAGALKNGSNTR